MISFVAMESESWTRESFVAADDLTNSQYHFGFAAVKITDKESNTILKSVKNLVPKFLIVSGSFHQDLAMGFYKGIAEITKKAKAKLIVDTSGEALKKFIEIGVYMIKPNVGELAKLIGVEQLELEAVDTAAK